ncbi:MAG: FlgD immunoglobulin-like domain containing protein [bacterium]|jgi:hypothetical protein
MRAHPLLIAALLAAFCLAWGGPALAQVWTIPEVYAGRPGIIGEVIEVEGFYCSSEWPVFMTDGDMAFARREIEPHAIMKVEGDLPPGYMEFSYIHIYGEVQSEPRPTPLWGEGEYLKLVVEAVHFIEPGEVRPPRREFEPRFRAPTPAALADDCTFALLLCSDDQGPDFWNDMVNYWNYVNNTLGISQDNILAFYHDGNSRNEGDIPSARLRPATHASIRQGFLDLKAKIEACEDEGKRAKLYKLVTDHGSGYHTGSGPDGPQNWSDGWAGGHIDQDGEEEDPVDESQLKFDMDGPAVGFKYEFDLDNDGTVDTELRNTAGTKEIWVKTGTGWVLAGSDGDGDGDIDADDGGVDLNGDGDKDDSFAWDEDLALSNDTRDILDDEWASWQKMLSDACLDSIYELIDCCFSGGFKKDEADSIPCKTFVDKAMASNEGEYSYGSADDGGAFAGPFMRGLMDSGWTWQEAFEKVSALEGVTELETPQWWHKDVAEPCEGIDIGIPDDIMVDPGENVYVPIYIQDVTGWGIMAFDMEICWCGVPAGLLQYEFCDPGEVMLNSSWADPVCGPCGENCISVAAAGAGPLAGGGVLFYLKFHVSDNAKPCMCCDIWFEHVNLYDPEDPLQVCWEDGRVCVEHCTVHGYVHNWYCDYDDCGGYYLTHPIEGARINLWDCNGPIASAYTDAAGSYVFECLPPGDPDCVYSYCVDVDNCEVPRRLITAYDASLILQHIVCLDDLDDCMFHTCMTWAPQRIAADVSCTNSITAYDASLVLQYVVGALPAFPCPDPWVWFPSPCDGCIYGCDGGVDYIGVLKGNVSGAPDIAPFAPPVQAYIKLGHPRHDAGTVKIPVFVRETEDIFSVELGLLYDTGALEYVSAVAGGLASGWAIEDRANADSIFIAMASATSFTGNGRIATLTFNKKRFAPGVPVASPKVNLNEAMFNEGDPVAVIEDNDYKEEIVKIGMGPIRPNPFSATTTISYALPAASHVSLSVYDVNGRLVKTLVDEDAEAGTHLAVWDGTDSTGHRVARGIYFCRMAADEFSATAKVVLLK